MRRTPVQEAMARAGRPQFVLVLGAFAAAMAAFAHRSAAVNETHVPEEAVGATIPDPLVAAGVFLVVAVMGAFVVWGRAR